MVTPHPLVISVGPFSEIKQVDAPKKKRASRPKVRTGCISCKARHVKCDERKPSCSRCEKAKQPCGGYASHKKILVKSIASSRAILPRGNSPPTSGLHIHVPRSRQSVFLSGADIGYFDYFRHSLIHDLSGQLNSNFWTKTVLSECMTDPCTRYAVLAIGALSRGLSDDSKQSWRVPISSVREGIGCILNDHHRSAICHHTKALSAFRDRVAHRASPRSVLVTTLLLITFELLQGNLPAADGLISTALDLQRDYLDARSSTTSVAEDLDELAFMLVRLSMFCSYNPFFVSQSSTVRIHKCPPIEHVVPGDVAALESHGIPVSSESRAWMKTNVAQILTLWNHFGTNCLVFVYNSAKIMEPALMEATQARFLTHLCRWRKVLQRYLGVPDLDLVSRRSVKVALIQLRKYYVCVKSVLDPMWLAWDEFGPEYSAIIDEVSEILPEPNEVETLTPAPVVGFTFDVFLLPLLVFVICKCRVRSDERKRALRLLETRLTWREGGWDARVLAKGLQALVAFEESGSIATADGKHFIPPESRYHWTSARWDEDIYRRGLIATCTRCIPDEYGQPVQVELSVDLGRILGGSEDDP